MITHRFKNLLIVLDYIVPQYVHTLNSSLRIKNNPYLCRHAISFRFSRQDFDKEPIPLKPKGKKPKFIKPADKHNANEGQYRVFEQDLHIERMFKSCRTTLKCVHSSILGLTLSDPVPIFISGENVFLFFEVEGNPPPDYKFHKGFKDLDVEPRYARWTDGGGDHNHVILGIKECRSVSPVSNIHSYTYKYSFGGDKKILVFYYEIMTSYP